MFTLVTIPETVEDVEDHVGHKVEIVTYGNDEVGTVNVAIECETCSQVLLDFDRQD